MERGELCTMCLMLMRLLIAIGHNWLSDPCDKSLYPSNIFTKHRQCSILLCFYICMNLSSCTVAGNSKSSPAPSSVKLTLSSPKLIPLQPFSAPYLSFLQLQLPSSFLVCFLCCFLFVMPDHVFIEKINILYHIGHPFT